MLGQANERTPASFCGAAAENFYNQCQCEALSDRGHPVGSRPEAGAHLVVLTFWIAIVHAPRPDEAVFPLLLPQSSQGRRIPGTGTAVHGIDQKQGLDLPRACCVPRRTRSALRHTTPFDRPPHAPEGRMHEKGGGLRVTDVCKVLIFNFYHLPLYILVIIIFGNFNVQNSGGNKSEGKGTQKMEESENFAPGWQVSEKRRTAVRKDNARAHMRSGGRRACPPGCAPRWRCDSGPTALPGTPQATHCGAPATPAAPGRIAAAPRAPSRLAPRLRRFKPPQVTSSQAGFASGSDGVQASEFRSSQGNLGSVGSGQLCSNSAKWSLQVRHHSPQASFTFAFDLEFVITF